MLFRYRVEDMLRGVSKNAVREERAAELKREVLNSERLAEYFAANPGDLRTLRHDKRAVPSNKQDTLHLAHVPAYLVPHSLRAAGGDGGHSLAGSRKRRRAARSGPGAGGASDPRRNTAADPLQSFTDTSAGGGGAGTAVGGDGAAKRTIYTKHDDTGEAMSGRRLWKMKHRKGEFSTKAGYQRRDQSKSKDAAFRRSQASSLRQNR